MPSPETQSQELAVISDNKELRVKEPLIDNEFLCTVLAQPSVPPRAIITAENFGIMSGLQSLLGPNASLNASNAITLMEAVAQRGYGEKVWFFARASAMSLASKLPNGLQQVEFFVRLAKLMPTDERHIWRKEAISRLKKEEGQENYCLTSTLIGLATLYVQAFQVDQTLYWLEKAKTASSVYVEIAEGFFESSLFEEGIRLLEARTSDDLSLLSNKPYNEQIPSPENFVECLAYYLKHKEQIGDASSKELLFRFQDHNQRSITLIKALNFIGKTDQALELAKQLCLRHQSIHFLLQFHQSIGPANEAIALTALYEIAKALPNFHQVMTTICQSKQFSVEKTVYMSSYLQTPSQEVSILRERACGLYLKKDKTQENIKDWKLILDLFVSV